MNMRLLEEMDTPTAKLFIFLFRKRIQQCLLGARAAYEAAARRAKDNPTRKRYKINRSSFPQAPEGILCC
jgi:hypothetical protein